MWRSASLGLLVAVSSSPCPAQRSAAAEHACFSAESHAEARSCLQREASRSEESLRAAEGRLEAGLAQWQEEPEYRTTASKRLARASATFRQARDAQCELQAAFAAGGNGAGDRRLLCIIELNARRIADLDASLAELAHGA